LKVIELELKNVQFIIKDLCSLRLEKILRNISKRKEQFESKLNPDEREYFNPLMDALRNFYSFISRTLEGEALEIKETIRDIKIKTLESERVAVRILENLPAIVGTDMKVYGPFKKGDIVVLPRKNSETLIRKKMAKIIDARIIT